ENRNGGPDLDETLEDEVGPTAEIALHRACRNADNGGREGEDEAEQNRYAEAIDHAGENIARLIVGAEPVIVAERAVRVVNAQFIASATLFLGVEPGRFGRGGAGNLVVHAVIGIADRRPDHPAIGVDLVLDEGIAIVGDREEAAKLLLRVIHQHGIENLAVVGGDDRLVVGDELGKERKDEEDHEDPERPVATTVRLEVLPAALVERRQERTSRAVAHFFYFRLR